MTPSELLNELKEYFMSLDFEIYDKQPQSVNGILKAFGEKNCIWVNIPTETRKILCKFEFHENDDNDIKADFKLHEYKHQQTDNCCYCASCYGRKRVCKCGFHSYFLVRIQCFFLTVAVHQNDRVVH